MHHIEDRFDITFGHGSGALFSHRKKARILGPSLKGGCALPRRNLDTTRGHRFIICRAGSECQLGFSSVRKNAKMGQPHKVERAQPGYSYRPPLFGQRLLMPQPDSPRIALKLEAADIVPMLLLRLLLLATASYARGTESLRETHNLITVLITVCTHIHRLNGFSSLLTVVVN